MNGLRIGLALSDHRSCQPIVRICLWIVDEFANGAITGCVENDLRLEIARRLFPGYGVCETILRAGDLWGKGTSKFPRARRRRPAILNST
jgi:hypothetical protein